MKKRILALLTSVLIASLSVMPVFADNYHTQDGDTWDGEVTGDTVSLDKYFVTSKTADILNVDFTYTVSSPASGFPTDGTNGQVVYAGIYPDRVKVTGSTDPVTPYIGVLNFSPADEPNAVLGDQNGNFLDSKKYVKKQLELDFSDITFTEPGIYRYYLEEKSSNGATENDTEVSDGNARLWRTIDVYVLDPDTNDVNDGHNTLTTGGNTVAPKYSVVYVGKLANDKLPGDVAAYDENTDFDITRTEYYDLSNTSRVWTYVDENTGIKYEYKANTVDPENGEWILTETDATGTITDRYANAPDDEATAELAKEYDITSFAAAKDAGMPKADIQNVSWTYTDTNGVIHTYTKLDDNNWTDVMIKATEEVAQPDNDAAPNNAEGKIEWYVSPTVIEEANSYGEAVNKKILNSTLRGYTWIKETNDTPESGVTETIIWTWDSSKGAWVKTTTYAPDGTVPYADMPDEAAPTTQLKTKTIKWKDALPLEKAAQKADGSNIKSSSNPNGAEAGYKSDRYVNEYYTQKLQVTKTVTGNQGSRDKYFEFTIELDTSREVGGVTVKAEEGTPIYVDWENNATIITLNDPADTDAKFNTATTESFATVHDTNVLAGKSAMDQTATDPADRKGIYYIDADGKATIKIFLQHGQSFGLKGIPQGTKYTVTETDYGTEGYEATTALSGEDVLTDDFPSGGTDIEVGKDKLVVEDTHLMKDAKVDFTNDKKGVIPTGVIMSVTGGAVMVALAAAYFVLRRRKDDEYYY